jgi:hypothetical protein
MLCKVLKNKKEKLGQGFTSVMGGYVFYLIITWFFLIFEMNLHSWFQNFSVLDGSSLKIDFLDS